MAEVSLDIVLKQRIDLATVVVPWEIHGPGGTVRPIAATSVPLGEFLERFKSPVLVSIAPKP